MFARALVCSATNTAGLPFPGYAFTAWSFPPHLMAFLNDETLSNPLSILGAIGSRLDAAWRACD